MQKSQPKAGQPRAEKVNPFDKLRIDAERRRSIKIQNYGILSLKSRGILC
jgi:hypothetical protein